MSAIDSDVGRPCDAQVGSTAEDGPRKAWGEVAAGVLLLALAGLVGLDLALHPGSDGFDRWIYSRVSMHFHSRTLDAIADVGNPLVVAVVGLVGALLVVRRDRRRAVACLAGPFVGGVLTEYVLKPLVDPRAGGLTFPSGHTVGVSAIVVVLALVLPRKARPYVIAVGAALGVTACYAVVVLGWHSPTDAVAGIAVGCGAVLVVDSGLKSLPTLSRLVTRHNESGRSAQR